MAGLGRRARRPAAAAGGVVGGVWAALRGGPLVSLHEGAAARDESGGADAGTSRALEYAARAGKLGVMAGPGGGGGSAVALAEGPGGGGADTGAGGGGLGEHSGGDWDTG